MKNRLKYILTTMFLFACSVSVASAEVTFNQAKANSDIKTLLDPISNVMMGAGFGITIVSIGWSYITYMGKEQEEKETMPFHKTVKKHVIAFILLGFAGVMLKWFSIS